MVQPIDSNRPIYNAVKINIKKPEVNKDSNINNYSDDNGIYNGVSIDIDNPSVNVTPKKIYDYPQSNDILTYDMANIVPITIPQDFHVAYHRADFVVPNIEVEEVDDNEPAINESKNEEINVPEPNYTTTEQEKEIATDKTGVYNDENNVEIEPEENIVIKEEAEIPQVNSTNIKKPEIIPGEDILPEVDIPLVVSNLANPDFDIQAQQMEEIARVSLDDKENAVPYIVKEVFSSLIDITKKDSSDLEAPSDEQIQARSKMIANFIAISNAKTGEKLPYELTEKEVELANTLSPMEMAERNKEYALYTIAILAKIYTNEVERQTGNVVPLTDIPGSAAIVDALRFNPNSGVKVAAIDSLKHIQRPEYDEELATLYSIAQSDSNPQVSEAASKALEKTYNY